MCLNSESTGAEVEGGLLTGEEEVPHEEGTRVAGGIQFKASADDDTCYINHFDCDDAGAGGLQALEGGHRHEGGAGQEEGEAGAGVLQGEEELGGFCI